MAKATDTVNISAIFGVFPIKCTDWTFVNGHEAVLALQEQSVLHNAKENKIQSFLLSNIH